MNYFYKIFIVIILSISSSTHANNSIVISLADTEYYSFQLMAKRILKLAYSRIGKTVEFEKSPAERSLVNANRGITDGELARIGGLEEEYPNLIMIPTPIAFDEIVAFTKETNFKVEGWSSLSSYRIGFIAGLKIAEQKTKGMKIEMVTSVDQGFKKLNLGRSDVFIGLKGNQCLIETLKLPEIKVMERPLEKITMYHYLNKSHSAIVAELDAVLKQMSESGEMGSIQRQSALEFLIQCNNLSKLNE